MTFSRSSRLWPFRPEQERAAQPSPTKIHPLNQAKRRRKPSSFMTFNFVIKGPVMPLFKACNLGTPTFAPGLGTARKADHLQRPHTRPALRHRLAPALVKAAFLSAHSPCGKATNIQGRRNKRQKQERKGPPQPARKTNAPGDDEKGQDKAARRGDVRPRKRPALRPEGRSLSPPGEA